ncbi:hypothetical protein Hanom_Chr04g00325091 [Helianthus anomalus]
MNPQLLGIIPSFESLHFLNYAKYPQHKNTLVIVCSWIYMYVWQLQVIGSVVTHLPLCPLILLV